MSANKLNKQEFYERELLARARLFGIRHARCDIPMMPELFSTWSAVQREYETYYQLEMDLISRGK